MRTRSPILALLLTGIASLAVPAAAQQYRLAGKVLDTAGEPVAGVSVLATSPELASFRVTDTTNSKGEFSVLVAAGSFKKLSIHLEHEGYAPLDSTFSIPRDGLDRRDFRMESIEVQRTRERQARATESDAAFNAALAAARESNWAEAYKKFEESLALRGDTYEARANLATAAWNLKDYPKAEEHARAGLKLNPGQPDLQRLLAEALEVQGKKEEAEAALAVAAQGDSKLQAEIAYNRGAELANQKKTEEALVAFQEAVRANPELVEAHYALGITALGAGKMDLARTHLARYLELAPEGSHAGTARQALDAIAPKDR